MKSERPRTVPQDLRWRVGLLVFSVLLAVGAACVAWTLHDLRGSGERATRQHAQSMAQSVADTLAQQLGRAARLGIPMAELPGVPAYLQSALDRQPVLRALAVEWPEGRTLHAVGPAPAPDDGAVVVRVPIAATTGAGGAVVVRASGADSARDSIGQAAALGAVAVLLLALTAALWAALGPGARLERQRRAVLARLQQPDGDGLPEDVGAPAAGPQAMLHALAEGDAEQRAARAGLQAYAQELLAVDFDGQMRADIERIAQGALPGQEGA